MLEKSLRRFAYVQSGKKFMGYCLCLESDFNLHVRFSEELLFFLVSSLYGGFYLGCFHTDCWHTPFSFLTLFGELGLDLGFWSRK